MNAFKTPQEKTIENIPGVVPENPFQYRLDLLHVDRDTCHRNHIGFSPAAINYMRSTADEVESLTRNIAEIAQQHLEHQLSSETENIFYTNVEDGLQKSRDQAGKLRADQFEYALMKRDHAQSLLDEAIEYEWDDQMIVRAGALLDLQGQLPTLEELQEYYISCNPRTIMTERNRNIMDVICEETVRIAESDPDHIPGTIPKGRPDKPEEFYALIFEEIVRDLLGDRYPADYTIPYNICSLVAGFHTEVLKSLHKKLLCEANNAYSEVAKNNTMTQAQARAIALYISKGETFDIYSISESDMRRGVFYGGFTITKAQVQEWYPIDVQKNSESA